MAWKPLFADTDEEAEKVLIELARKTPAREKVKQIESLNQTCRQLAMAGLRKRYPQASEEELHLRLAAILFGREISVEVFGWDPEVEGY